MKGQMRSCSQVTSQKKEGQEGSHRRLVRGISMALFEDQPSGHSRVHSDKTPSWCLTELVSQGLYEGQVEVTS